MSTRIGTVLSALALLMACGGGTPPNATSETPAEPAAAEAPVRTPEAPPPDETPAPIGETKAEAKAETKAEFPKADPALDAKIKKTFGDNCRLERKCKDILGVDCQAATDGPYYYVHPGSLEVISKCGGACMGGKCTNCPPKEWTCAVY